MKILPVCLTNINILLLQNNGNTVTLIKHQLFVSTLNISQPPAAAPAGEARIKKPTAKTPPKQGNTLTHTTMQKMSKVKSCVCVCVCVFGCTCAALPPQILQFPEDMKILAGEKVEILCKFSGAPSINCTWLKFRKPVRHARTHARACALAHTHTRTHT